MDKLKMHTLNKADENFKKLAALFPNAVTETIDENGVVVRAIDKQFPSFLSAMPKNCPDRICCKTAAEKVVSLPLFIMDSLQCENRVQTSPENRGIEKMLLLLRT